MCAFQNLLAEVQLVWLLCGYVPSVYGNHFCQLVFFYLDNTSYIQNTFEKWNFNHSLTKRMQTNIKLKIPNKQATTKATRSHKHTNTYTKKLCQIASERLEANFLDLQAINFPHFFCRSNQILVFDSNNDNNNIGWLNWFIHVQDIQFASKVEQFFFFFGDVKSCSCVKLCIVYGWDLLCCCMNTLEIEGADIF